MLSTWAGQRDVPVFELVIGERGEPIVCLDEQASRHLVHRREPMPVVLGSDLHAARKSNDVEGGKLCARESEWTIIVNWAIGIGLRCGRCRGWTSGKNPTNGNSPVLFCMRTSAAQASMCLYAGRNARNNWCLWTRRLDLPSSPHTGAHGHWTWARDGLGALEPVETSGFASISLFRSHIERVVLGYNHAAFYSCVVNC